MTQAYSNPKRESDLYALPDVEIFYLSDGEIGENAESDSVFHDLTQAGFYYWSCFPGCLPDSDPFGPFETEEQALQAAQDDSFDFDDESDDDN